MDTVAFEPAAKWLLFVHFVSGVIVLSTIVHLLWRMVDYLRGHGGQRFRVWLHSVILAIGYVVCFVSGALVYPTFRVRVRAEFFDQAIPWATGLFETKEHWASIGLPAVLGLLLLAWPLTQAKPEDRRRIVPIYIGLAVVVLGIVGYNVWAGWYLSTILCV